MYAALFAEEGLADVSMDDAGNAFGRLKSGTASAKPLVVSAHLDTVFPAGTDLTVTRNAGKIHGPGLGDNSLGVAALFGLLWLLQERKIDLPGNSGLWPIPVRRDWVICAV